MFRRRGQRIGCGDRSPETLRVRQRGNQRRIATAAWIAVVALVAACSGGDGEAEPDLEPTPTSAPVPTTEADEPKPTATARPTPLVIQVPVFAGDDDPLRFDDTVRRGTLSNGLTYYIRPNTAPGGRAELRLAVDAGSTLEDEDQSAVAHFLEHMLFNGTERYPANELIRVLESFGSEFGPDVNAYTSLDETVYELSVATDDAALLSEALDVLREWAGNATIDPEEVIAERGVVLEEWRLRDQGLGGRVSELYVDLLTARTDYEGRLPIGEPEAISTMTADVLQRFYHDWYRPDLMAVVVVGDVDVDAVEAMIRRRFGDLVNPANPRPPDDVVIEDATDFSYARLADPEVPSAYIELIHPGPAGQLATVGDYRRLIASSLASSIISERFADDVSRGDAPYLRAYTSVTPIARQLDTPGLLAEGPADVLEESFELLLVELERVKRNGFSDDEVARAIDTWRAGLEQRYAGRDTTQDVDYASEYVEHFVADAPSLSWDDFFTLENRLLDDMNAEYLRAVYLDGIAGRAPQVVVVGPASDGAALPSEDAVRRLLDETPSRDVAPRTDDSQAVDSLMAVPEPAPVTDRVVLPGLDATRLTFANQVTVVLKQTTIAENSFSLGATAPGGRSVLDSGDLAAAFVMADVVTSSGVGDLDQVELDRLLADRVAFVNLAVEETTEGVFGGGSTDDAEIVLQLVNRYLSAPRVQPAALATAVGELEPFVDDPGQFPFLASTVALFDARYGGDPRYQLLPGRDELVGLTARDIERVFEASVSDASGTVFAIVGDFDAATMEDLAARYLGTLRSDGEPDEWLDLQPSPPTGIIERIIEVGQDPQGSTTVLITAEVAVDRREIIELEVLENVLSTRLRDRLREALGATYSPAVSVRVADAPDPLVETLIEVSGDPDGLDTIDDEIQAVIADLRNGGLTRTEVDSAREQVRRNYELVSNGFWIDQLLFDATHPDNGVLTVSERLATAAGVTVSDLDAMIDRVLLDDRYIAITLLPEG